MDKEKYLEMRKIEEEKYKCHDNNSIIYDFLRDYKEYLREFKSKEAIKAIEGLKEFTELMDLKAEGLRRVFRGKLNEYSKECTHDIVIFDDREEYKDHRDDCFCPLCRKHINKEELKDNTMIIGVFAIYNCEDPSQGDCLYPIIDYMIENNLNFAEEEYFRIYDILFPEHIYKQFKKNYKVRVKK